MKLDVKRNAINNIKYGMIFRTISTIMPFVIRTVIINVLGTEMLGLNSLCSSILQVLNLTELGFSDAVVNSMYEPIAKDDKGTICKLLQYYKRIYRYVGMTILIIGLLIMPFLKYFIRDEEIIDANIYLVYILFLCNTTLGYFLYAYKQSLWKAFQRFDLYCKVGSVINGVMYALQVLVLIVTKNFYVYIIIMLIMTVVYNLFFSYILDRNYPQYRCEGEISNSQKREIKDKVYGLMINKCSSMSRNSLDTIFVSSFIGISIAAIYSNYYYVLIAVSNVMLIISNSLLAGVGNNIVLKSPQENYKDLTNVNFVYLLLSGACSIYMLCLLQPFMRLWVGEDNLLDFSVVVCFSLYFVVLKMSDVRALYSNAIGLWWKNRWWSIIQIIANVLLNFVGCYFMGVLGVVVATIFTMFCIDFIYGNKVLFRCYFGEKYWEFIKINICYLFVAVLLGLVALFLCEGVQVSSLIVTLIIRTVICTIVIILGYGCIFRKKIRNLIVIFRGKN